MRLSYVPKKALATGGVPFVENPFRDEEAEIEVAGDRRDENPYTVMEGYELQDASGTKVSEIEETVYDAVSGVLKYVIAEGHTIPADGIEVDAENGPVRVPYEREAIESAPAPQDPSGEFDQTLRGHYENREERG